jgi:hypothetical protein
MAFLSPKIFKVVFLTPKIDKNGIFNQNCNVTVVRLEANATLLSEKS